MKVICFFHLAAAFFCFDSTMFIHFIFYLFKIAVFRAHQRLFKFTNRPAMSCSVPALTIPRGTPGYVLMKNPVLWAFDCQVLPAPGTFDITRYFSYKVAGDVPFFSVRLPDICQRYYPSPSSVCTRNFVDLPGCPGG